MNDMIIYKLANLAANGGEMEKTALKRFTREERDKAIGRAIEHHQIADRALYQHADAGIKSRELFKWNNNQPSAESDAENRRFVHQGNIAMRHNLEAEDQAYKGLHPLKSLLLGGVVGRKSKNKALDRLLKERGHLPGGDPDIFMNVKSKRDYLQQLVDGERAGHIWSRETGKQGD